jgi:glycosyltransferase involved in cell wall biosynthesis
MHGCGHVVSVVYWKNKEVGIAAEMEALGFPVYSLRGGFLARHFRALRLLRRLQPDIIHSVLFESNFLARLGSIWKRKVVRVESLVNTPYVSNRQIGGRITPWKFWIVKKIDCLSAQFFRAHYHAITRTVLDHYQPLFRIPSCGYSVVYRGRSNTGRRASGSYQPGHVFKLISVGRQEFQKGQWLVIEALRILRDHYKMDFIELTIVGRAGDQTARMEKMVQEFRLGDQVVITGFRNDVSQLLDQSDAFVFPSYFEGLGGALIEAFEKGLPCICSNLPVLREVAGSDQTAIFFETNSASALAESIQLLVTDAPLRKQLGDRARARYESNFLLDEVHQRMEGMYHYLLKA